MADTLATPSDLASYMQQDLDASSAVLALELATAAVQRAAGGQRILDVTDTAIMDVESYYPDYYWLDLPQKPIRSVTSVEIDGVAVTDFFLRKQRLWRLLGWRGVTIEPTQVEVTYAHGYVAGSQWLQLARDATLSLAASAYNAGPQGGGTVESEKIDDYSVSYGKMTDAIERSFSGPLRAAIASAYGTLTTVVQTTCY